MDHHRAERTLSARPHFRIAGVPVRIEPIFWFATVLLGFNLGEPPLIVTWVGVVLVSILVHEFGHAFALKAYGQSSSIIIHGFGGLTLSQRRLTRIQSILVSLAGPLTALVALGIPAVMIDRRMGDDLYFDWIVGGQSFGWYPVLEFAIYVNIWWSLANLLPIRPLDGGNVMTELIGIDRARIASVIVGAAAAVYAFTQLSGLRYVAFFAGFLAFINLSEYRRSKRGDRGPSAFDVDAPAPLGGGGILPGHNTGSVQRVGKAEASPTVVNLAGGVDAEAAEAFAWNLLRSGDADAAATVVGRSTSPVGPFVSPTVATARGEGTEALRTAYLENPSGPSNLVPALVLARCGHAEKLAADLIAAGPVGVDAASSIQTHLHYGERFAESAAVGALRYPSAGRARAQVAFDVACSQARAGDVDVAFEWLNRAVTDGFGASVLLDGDADLEVMRADARWAALRSRVGSDD